MKQKTDVHTQSVKLATIPKSRRLKTQEPLLEDYPICVTL